VIVLSVVPVAVFSSGMISGIDGQRVEGTNEKESPIIAMGIAGNTKLSPRMRCAGSTKTAPITANRIHNQIQISIA
jgi:hypothetical protein